MRSPRLAPSGARALRSPRLAALALAASFVGLLASGCTRPATQLVVVVETDLVAGRDYDCFGLIVSRITDAGVERGASYRFLEVPADVEAPFSFGVTPPGGDARLRVEVAVEALHGCTEPAATDRVVRRAARTGFVEGRVLRLPLFLPASCGAGCLATESCPAVGPECVTPPEVEPTMLAPIVPGQELVDAASVASPDAGLDAAALDAGPLDDAPVVRADADLMTTCTTVRAAAFAGLSVGSSHVLVPRLASDGWRLFWDTGSSTSFQDAAGGMNMLVLDGLSSVRLVPFGALTTVGDDIQLLGTIEGRTTVSRWWGPAYDTPVEALPVGPLRSPEVAALPDAQLLVLVDGGAGARNTLWRLPALSGTPTELGPLAADAFSVTLAPRSDGALAAIAGGVGACELVPLGMDGTPSTRIVVPVSGLCARAAVAAVGARAIFAHVSGPSGAEEAAYHQIDLGGGGVVGPAISLGPARPTNVEAVVDPISGNVRVVWQDGTALASLAVSSGGAPGAYHCILDVMGATTTNYDGFQAAQRSGVTGVSFVGGTRGQVMLAEIAGP